MFDTRRAEYHSKKGFKAPYKHWNANHNTSRVQFNCPVSSSSLFVGYSRCNSLGSFSQGFRLELLQNLGLCE